MKLTTNNAKAIREVNNQPGQRKEIDMRLHKRISSTVMIIACMLSLGGASAHAESPNILFIPVDDLNHWCGYTGRNKQAKTPNIDQIKVTKVNGE